MTNIQCDYEAGALVADRVYSFQHFAAFVGVSVPTLRRLIAKGDGPPITHLSERRVGIRGRHGSAWLDSRARAAQ
jgi:predicted DNA-binding transcriptional regulator AlpA